MGLNLGLKLGYLREKEDEEGESNKKKKKETRRRKGLAFLLGTWQSWPKFIRESGTNSSRRQKEEYPMQ